MRSKRDGQCQITCTSGVPNLSPEYWRDRNTPAVPSNFKTYTKSLKFKKRMMNPKENQRVFEDTQPAIIERGTVGTSERITGQTNADRQRQGKQVFFSGLVYCADCGAKLYYCTCNTYKDDSQDILNMFQLSRATQAPARFIISRRSRFTRGFWNVFRER